MVRYKVKADRAAENENYIRKIFEELKQTELKGSATHRSSKTMD
jgi:hypothetical protein